MNFSQSKPFIISTLCLVLALIPIKGFSQIQYFFHFSPDGNSELLIRVGDKFLYSHYTQYYPWYFHIQQTSNQSLRLKSCANDYIHQAKSEPENIHIIQSDSSSCINVYLWYQDSASYTHVKSCENAISFKKANLIRLSILSDQPNPARGQKGINISTIENIDSIYVDESSFFKSNNNFKFSEFITIQKSDSSFHFNGNAFTLRDKSAYKDDILTCITELKTSALYGSIQKEIDAVIKDIE